MKATEITIRVEPEAAQVYLATSERQRRKLDAILSLRLGEIGHTRELNEVIRDAAIEARTNGLTSEALEELLRDE